MSEKMIYFVTEANSIEQAEDDVTDYLENEGFWSYSCRLPEFSGSLAQMRQKLVEFSKEWDWKKKADGFLVQAEKYKSEGNFCMYGHFLIYAGELYSKRLTTETCIFNIESEDYSLPKEDNNWWVIAIELYH